MDDLRHGIWTTWYTNGVVAIRTRYDHDHVEEQVCFDEDGADLDCAEVL